MRRCLVTFALIALGSAALGADVTVTTTSTLEGAMAPMMPGAAPSTTMRIKGMKVRLDMGVMGQGFATITDVSTKRIIMLMSPQKTAQVMDMAAGTLPFPLPKMDITLEPSGQTQNIDGRHCDGFTYAMTMDMAQMMTLSPQIPKEAAEMLKDVKMVMKGMIWIATDGPGVEEYRTLQKAATLANLPFGTVGGAPGTPAQGNLNQMMQLFGKDQGGGIPYLTQMEMRYEGTGPMIDMLNQMGTVKITTKVTEVSTAILDDEAFTVPPDYTFRR